MLARCTTSMGKLYEGPQRCLKTHITPSAADTRRSKIRRKERSYLDSARSVPIFQKLLRIEGDSTQPRMVKVRKEAIELVERTNAKDAKLVTAAEYLGKQFWTCIKELAAAQSLLQKKKEEDTVKHLTARINIL